MCKQHVQYFMSDGLPALTVPSLLSACSRYTRCKLHTLWTWTSRQIFDWIFAIFCYENGFGWYSDQTVCSVEAMLESYHLLFSFKTISGGNTLFLNQNGYCTQILFTLEMNSNSIAKALVWDVNSSLVTCFQYYSAIVCRTCVNKQLVVTGCLKGCGNTFSGDRQLVAGY